MMADLYEYLECAYENKKTGAWDTFLNMCRSVARCANDDEVWPVLMKWMSDMQFTEMEMEKTKELADLRDALGALGVQTEWPPRKQGKTWLLDLVAEDEDDAD